jgi:hypothetical protein
MSDDRIEEFWMLWEQEYGEQLSDEQASEYAHRVLAMMRAIYKPIKIVNPLDDDSKENMKALDLL